MIHEIARRIELSSESIGAEPEYQISVLRHRGSRKRELHVRVLVGALEYDSSVDGSVDFSTPLDAQVRAAISDIDGMFGGAEANAVARSLFKLGGKADG